MTSTGTYKGLNDDRNSSKVLKPPGGGSSDIFGAGPEETSPRRAKNYNQSQLGTALFGENTSNGPETPRNKPGNDSYKRLFGPPDALPTPKSKNHMRSDISLSGESSTTLSSPAKSTSSVGNVINGSSNGDITDGNPVTGTGYANAEQRSNAAPLQNGNGGASLNGTDKSSNETSPGFTGASSKIQAPRTRVPPGGYSSALW